MEITFPKNWKNLTEQEQKEWINTYFQEKTKTPEPYPITDTLKSGQTIETKHGHKIHIPEGSLFKEKNPDLVREYEGWANNWLITVFHDKKCPVSKIFSISNPHSEKWIAQDLSFENWSNLFKNLVKIGNKYRFLGKKKAKMRR